MYCDDLLKFSSAQAITAAAASTSYLDLGVARDMGCGEDLYVVTVVTTALTDGGSNTGTDVYLYYDSTTTFTPDAKQKLYSFPQAAAAGTVRYAKISPVSTNYQYAEVYYDPQGANLTAGNFTSFIVKDISNYVNYAKGYTIS